MTQGNHHAATFMIGLSHNRPKQAKKGESIMNVTQYRIQTLRELTPELTFGKMSLEDEIENRERRLKILGKDYLIETTFPPQATSPKVEEPSRLLDPPQESAPQQFAIKSPQPATTFFTPSAIIPIN